MPQNIWQCTSNLSKHATVMSGLILGLYQWPLTGLLCPTSSEGGGLRGNDRWTHGCWNLDCHCGPAGYIHPGCVVTSPNRLTANLPTPLVPAASHPQQHSHSCLAPLTHMTAETPKQLELMTLVSREIVCPAQCVWLQTGLSLSLTHVHTHS